jgi:CHAT domain-containing protein
MKTIISIILGLGIVFSISGCQTLPVFSDKPEVYVMESLANEECRYRQSFADEYKQFGSSQFEIYCGKWEHPSGHVFKVPISNHDVSLKQWASSGEWRKWLDSQMICEPGSNTTMIEGFKVHILSCKLRNGNWPYMAGVVLAGDAIYLTDGVPTIMPVVEATIGQLSGEFVRPTEMTADTRSKALKRLRSFIKGPIYGSRELMEYYRLMSAGQFYNSIKDYTTSALRYQKALQLHEQVLGKGDQGLVDPLMHLALEVSNQGNFAQAENQFERARILAQQSPDRSDLARYLSYRALHAANRRKFKEALDLAQQATIIRKNLLKHYQQPSDRDINLDSRQRVDFAVFSQVETPTVVDIVQSLYIEASMLVRLGKPVEAEKVLREAVDILKRAREAPPSWIPEFEGLIAHLAKAKGAENERSEHLKTATTLWESFAPGERPSAINFLELGNALQVQGRSDEALEAFRHAVQLVKVRNGSLSYEQLLPYFTTVLELAEQRPDEKQQLHAEIFTAGQLIRSKLTTQNIAMAVARLAADKEGAGKVIREYQDAQDERFLLQQAYDAEMAKLAGDQQTEMLESIETKLTDVNTRLKSLTRQVQAAFPRYNQLVDSAIGAERVIGLIKSDEALVQIVLGIDDGMVFVVTDEKVTAFPIDISFLQAEGLVDKLRSGLKPTSAGRLQKFDVALAYQTYRRLFNPVIEEISGKQLITVPAGPFLSLPFGVLVTEDTLPIEGGDYSQVEWLAKSSAISLLPSVRSFVGLRDDVRISRAEKAFIGFGDFVPVNKSSDDQLSEFRSGYCQRGNDKIPDYMATRARFDPLPATKLEISKVVEAFPGMPVQMTLGADFNDQALKNMPLHEYQVLYFATHGLLPNALECHPQPSLVTSPPQVLAGKDDGFLDMEEILQLKLDADLVVLSACDTGGPDKKGGENLSGLARAFFFSGARSLLVSHWPAADEATVKLMTGIFDHLHQNPEAGLAKALQYVQNGFLGGPGSVEGNYSHPFFWANFTAVGDGKKGLQQNYQVVDGNTK